MLRERIRVKIEEATSVLNEGLDAHVYYFQKIIESFKYFS
jgi:hypothetical protein